MCDLCSNDIRLVPINDFTWKVLVQGVQQGTIWKLRNRVDAVRIAVCGLHVEHPLPEVPRFRSMVQAVRWITAERS